MTWLRWSPDGTSAGAFCCLHPSGPNVAANLEALAATLRHCVQRAADVGEPLNSARPSAREVFESCMTLERRGIGVETTPIARPVIYTLAGCHPGERCVIERTPDGFSSRTHDTGAANDWLLYRPRWEARVAAEALLTRTFDEAAEKVRRRREHLAAWPGSFEAEFDWVTPPVLIHRPGSR